MSNEFWIALIGFFGGILGSAVAELAKYVGRRYEEQRQTRIKYLHPLKLASEDLLRRWRQIAVRIEAGKGAEVTAEFRAIRSTCGQPWFYRDCNEQLCGPVGTLYATACYFAFAARLREQLPLLRMWHWRALDLLDATEKVRSGIGNRYGLWEEIQDSIGGLVLATTNEHVIPFGAFCKALSQDTNSYLRLFDFYEEIDQKYKYELHKGCRALERVDQLLCEILGSPVQLPAPEPTWNVLAPAPSAA